MLRHPLISGRLWGSIWKCGAGAVERLLKAGCYQAVSSLLLVKRGICSRMRITSVVWAFISPHHVHYSGKPVISPSPAWELPRNHPQSRETSSASFNGNREWDLAKMTSFTRWQREVSWCTAYWFTVVIITCWLLWSGCAITHFNKAMHFGVSYYNYSHVT